MAAALSAVMGLASCDGGDAKLAGELVGTWKGQPAEMMNGDKGKPDKNERTNQTKETVKERVTGATQTGTMTGN